MSSTTSVLLLVLYGLTACQFQVSNTLAIPTLILSHEEFKCIPADFPSDHVCRTLFPNLTSVMAPNPSQINGQGIGFFSTLTAEQHFDASLGEFEKLAGLMTEDDQCSNKVATLLCFFYFPACNVARVASEDVTVTSFPCRSLCEEVTALDSECTRRISNTWGPYFQGCNYTYGEDKDKVIRQVYTEENCVRGTHLSYYDIKHPVELEGEDCKKLDNSLLKSSWSSKCNYRRRVNEKLFDSNNHNFAINCTVNSVLPQGPFGREVVNCTVNKQFQLKDKESCTDAPEIEEKTSILISGRASSCESTSQRKAIRNSILVNETYIIVGRNVIREDCEDCLWFTNVVAPLTPKLNNFFVRSVARENAKRCENKTVQ